jgi:hypothetical protein
MSYQEHNKSQRRRNKTTDQMYKGTAVSPLLKTGKHQGHFSDHNCVTGEQKDVPAPEDEESQTALVPLTVDH